MGDSELTGVGILTLLAATLLWTFPKLAASLVAIAIFMLTASLLLILAFGILTVGNRLPLLFLSALPYAAVVGWRCKRLLQDWVA
jgi:hypothetical protein